MVWCSWSIDRTTASTFRKIAADICHMYSMEDVLKHNLDSSSTLFFFTYALDILMNTGTWQHGWFELASVEVSHHFIP